MINDFTHQWSLQHFQIQAEFGEPSRRFLGGRWSGHENHCYQLIELSTHSLKVSSYYTQGPCLLFIIFCDLVSRTTHLWTSVSLFRLVTQCKLAPATGAQCSLVPRPFPPPVFDRILYAKTEGEGLGERVTCVTSGRREGRH